MDNDIVLRSTKMIAPKRSGKLLVRHKILERLYRERHKRLMILEAPAGYGKTNIQVQLYELLHNNNNATCWLSCDEADNFITFIHYLIHAIDSIQTGFGRDTLSVIEANPEFSSHQIDTLFLNDINTLEDDVYLFLDDVHLIADQEILKLLNEIITTPNCLLHLCISTRNATNLQYAKLFLLNEITHLTSDELKFDADETHNFLTSSTRKTLHFGQSQEICSRTEGWIAGIQLASIMMQDQNHSEKDYVIPSTQLDVGKYLADEVFNSLSEELKSFLTKTSVLKKFNVEACNAILGIKNSHELINLIDQKNLFLFSLDKKKTWFRYHHYFSDFLQDQIAFHEPELKQHVHVEASQYFENTKNYDDALHHSIQANDIASTARILNRASSLLFKNGRTSTIEKYARLIPENLISQLPRLQLDMAWTHMLQLEFENAAKILKNVKGHLESLDKTSDEYERLNIEYQHRLVCHYFRSDKIEETLHLAEEWFKNYSTDDAFMCASVRAMMMACKKQLFKTDDVILNAPVLYSLFLKADATYGTVFHDSIMGSIFAMRCLNKDAEYVLLRAIERAHELHGKHSALKSMPSVVYAELQYNLGNIESSHNLLNTYDYLFTKIGFTENFISGFITKSKIYFLKKEYLNAEEVLNIAESFSVQYKFKRLTLHVVSERIRQYLIRGKIKEAQKQLSSQIWSGHTFSEHNFDQGVSVRDEQYLIASARISASQGGSQTHIAQLKKWAVFLSSSSAMMSLIRIQLLLAIQFKSRDDLDRSAKYFKDALSLAAVHNVIGPFLDESNQLSALLSIYHRSIFNDKQLDHVVNHIIAVVNNNSILESPLRLSEVDETECETLNEREIEILTNSLNSTTNHEIASSLGLKESTIKWYWQRIYAKLNVNKKSEAIKKAKTLHVI